MTMEVEPPKDFFFSSYYFAQININVYMLFNVKIIILCFHFQNFELSQQRLCAFLQCEWGYHLAQHCLSRPIMYAP